MENGIDWSLVIKGIGTIICTIFAVGGVGTLIVGYRLRRREKKENKEDKRLEDKKRRAEKLEVQVRKNEEKIVKVEFETKQQLQKMTDRMDGFESDITKIKADVSDVKETQKRQGELTRATAFERCRYLCGQYIRRGSRKITEGEYMTIVKLCKSYLLLAEGNPNEVPNIEYLNKLLVEVNKLMVAPDYYNNPK